MLRDTAVDIIMGRLGQRNETALRDKIIKEMVAAQERLEETPPHPWFMHSAVNTTVLVGASSVALDVEFLGFVDEERPHYTKPDGERVFLERMDYDELLKVYGQVEGWPVAFAMRTATSLALSHTAEQSFQITLAQYRRQTSLEGTYGGAGNIENFWLTYASDLLIAETGAIIARGYLQSEKMAARFEADIVRAQQRLWKKDAEMRDTLKQHWMEG